MRIVYDPLFQEPEDLECLGEDKIKKFQKEHKKEMDNLKKTQKCLCGADVTNATVYDRGWNCGVECEFCK